MARVSLKSRNVSRRKAGSQRKDKNTSGTKKGMVIEGLGGSIGDTLQKDVEHCTNLFRDEKESSDRKDRDVGRGNEVLPTKKVEFSESLWRFENEIENVVFGKAFSKGYAGRELDKFMESNFPHHALGEIVYKAIRYKAKRDPEDLVKIAAWSLLLFDRIQRNENKQESSNKDRNEIS